MESEFYRKILNSESLGIDLPKNLQHKEVEVIILPHQKNKKTESKEEVKNKEELFDNIKGIWNDSEIDLDNIREEIWNR